MKVPSLILGSVLAITVSAGAQAPPSPSVPATPPAPPAAPAPPAPPAPEAGAQASKTPRVGPRVSLDVQVAIVRSQGGTVISRLPHTLTVVTNSQPTQLNMGAEVPVPTTTFTPARPAPPRPPASGTPGQPSAPAVLEPPAAPPQPLQSVSYRNVGTVIVCSATGAEGGVYELSLSVDDSAVLPRDAADAAQVGPGLPAFRSFRTRNTLLLRDGQTRTFSVATDRVSGEEVQVEVKLTVLK